MNEVFSICPVIKVTSPYRLLSSSINSPKSVTYVSSHRFISLLLFKENSRLKDIENGVGNLVGKLLGIMGLSVGRWDGWLDGNMLGCGNVTGLKDGFAEGLLENLELGYNDGETVGKEEEDGFAVGLFDGIVESCLLGLVEGLLDGVAEGLLVGLSEGGSDVD